uniref:Clu domain-containing protein n=1 Tax=Schistosoma curassoni TaxID=6186 RepID=A0A183KW77_9TREM
LISYFRSTDDQFNPHPIQHAYVAHSLIDLLRQLSPGFKRNFESLLKNRAAKHPFERVPTPYQVHSWLAPLVEHSPDSVRKEEAFSSRMACEENLPGQTRDWNEELQVTRELPQTRLTERLLRDRAIFKSNSDFVAAATRAAVSVVNGDIMAINPGETRKQQMFIWNNMFFSLGFDVKDHYKHFGGEYAAYAATSSDLCGVRAYSMLDQPGLYTLGTAIIDYRGFRVTAQTIIPGILEKEQEQLVVYGSIDFGKTVLTDKRYEELLSKTAKQLKIKPHKFYHSTIIVEALCVAVALKLSARVVNQSGDAIQLYSSVDCKGIVGNDNRTYILDLLRTFPPDLNYLDNGSDIRPQLSPELVKLGYPYQHRHMLATLRQELIEAFFDHRYEKFLRLAALEIQKGKSSLKGECDDQVRSVYIFPLFQLYMFHFSFCYFTLIDIYFKSYIIYHPLFGRFDDHPKCLCTTEGGESPLTLSKCSHMTTSIQPLPGKSYSMPSRGRGVYEIERTKSECPRLNWVGGYGAFTMELPLFTSLHCPVD